MAIGRVKLNGLPQSRLLMEHLSTNTPVESNRRHVTSGFEEGASNKETELASVSFARSGLVGLFSSTAATVGLQQYPNISVVLKRGSRGSIWLTLHS